MNMKNKEIHTKKRSNEQRNNAFEMESAIDIRERDRERQRETERDRERR